MLSDHLQELESFLKGVGFEQTYDMSGNWSDVIDFVYVLEG